MCVCVYIYVYMSIYVHIIIKENAINQSIYGCCLVQHEPQ